MLEELSSNLTDLHHKYLITSDIFKPFRLLLTFLNIHVLRDFLKNMN